ncbi:MAG: ketoacyl-ACP synthase III [Candidatus Latescibacteria bacterium]|nr:ketoacyl-ACP synthase III [Candidatus Latescibacterota bacterium]
MLRRSAILGVGSAVPKRVLTNFDVEKMVDTTDEWIRTRTGIERRRIASPEETTASLSAGAALNALYDADLDPLKIDVIMIATVTPEMSFPSTGCVVQDAIGAKNAAAMDISAACPGFLYALSIADTYVTMGRYDYILVVGAETLSRIVDWTDRNTCVLFGDGAGAVVVGPSRRKDDGILDVYIRSDGSKGDLLCMPGGGSKHPPSHETVERGMHHIKMQGPELFKAAVMAMEDAAVRILERVGMTGDDIDLFIPHQANMRIISATAKKMGVPMEKVYVNLQEYGNTSSASIPIALDEARRKGIVKTGQTIVMVSFGGGLTWGSAVVRF